MVDARLIRGSNGGTAPDGRAGHNVRSRGVTHLRQRCDRAGDEEHK